VNELLLGVAMFLRVFLMGFQSKNVVGNHYRTAFITSLAMGLMEVYVVVGIVDAGWSAAIPVCLGGSTGIVLSMWLHSYLFPQTKPARPNAGRDAAASQAEEGDELLCPWCLVTITELDLMCPNCGELTEDL
jgi:hypothetical protein